MCPDGLPAGHLEVFLNNLSWLIKASVAHLLLLLSGEARNAVAAVPTQPLLEKNISAFSFFCTALRCTTQPCRALCRAVHNGKLQFVVFFFKCLSRRGMSCNKARRSSGSCQRLSGEPAELIMNGPPPTGMNEPVPAQAAAHLDSRPRFRCE